MSEHQSGTEDVVAARLMADPELDGPVGVPLAVLDEHLERFTADRPFLTTEDALRAVLRDSGVRAKLAPAHLCIVGWSEDGGQLMEIHPNCLSRSRRT
ncbi:hypothetical protein [Kocuria sp. CH-021]|uniref:hypothetical protein n=1 Tax=Kocuria sp. CH-021 TaxID=3406735 RepID=UPI003C73C8CB